MKKLVALVLALVMTLSLCTVTAFADPTIIETLTISNITGVKPGKKVSDVHMTFGAGIEDSFKIIQVWDETISDNIDLQQDEFISDHVYVIFAILRAKDNYVFKIDGTGADSTTAYELSVPNGFTTGVFPPYTVGNTGEPDVIQTAELTQKNASYTKIHFSFTVSDDTTPDDVCNLDCETLAKVGMAAVGVVTAVVVTKVVVDKLHAIKAAKIAAAEEAKLAEMPMVAFGDSGDAVTTLQTELNAQGYNCGEADGVFGQNTLNAVMAFQTAKGLTADGVVGAQTWGALL